MSAWKLFLIVAPVFLAVDLLWLGVVMKDFYSRELGDLARRVDGALVPRWGAAALVYLMIPAGLVCFARPVSDSQTLVEVVGRAALFGLLLYGVYDFTNLATLEKWSFRMTLADLAWGATLSAAMGGLMFRIERG